MKSTSVSESRRPTDRFSSVMQERIALVLSVVSIIAIPISLSLSHLFIFLTLIHLLVSRSYRGLYREMTPIFYTASLFYLLLLLLSIYHSLLTEHPLKALSHALFSELKGLWLLLFSVTLLRFKHSKESRRVLVLALLAVSLLIVVTGVMGALSPYRLARYLLDRTAEITPANRLQHIRVSFSSVVLYQSIGFMGTHLTFGGLLMTALPISFALVVSPHQSIARYVSRLTSIRQGRVLALSALFFVLLVALLYLNDARSAQIATLFSLGALFVVFYGSSLLQRRRLILFTGGVLILMLAGYLMLVVVQAGSVRSGVNLIKSAGFKGSSNFLALSFRRSSDYQRLILWNESYELFKAHPIAGVGSGNFKESILNFRKEEVVRAPELWYFIDNTRADHAHNDTLHFLAAGGILSGLLYLTVAASLFYLILKRNEGNRDEDEFMLGRIFCTSALTLFIGGLFQCYLLDSPVALLFWVSVATGTILQSSADPASTPSREDS